MPGREKDRGHYSLRLPNAEKKALGAADTFTKDGTLDEVVVLGQDDTRLN